MTRGRVLLALLMLWGLAMIVPDLSRIVQPLGSFGFYADNDGVIPLLDIGDLDKPQIDVLVVDGTRTERQPIQDPAPHEKHVWVTTVVVEDTYHASLV